jgi:hypothetical protein
MTSILKADTIQDTDGNNIINESGNTITIGASGDTVDIPSGATFDATGATITGITQGITVADQFRLSANVSFSSTTDFTSNLERIDTSGQGGMTDNQMSESSGIFTFPLTGIYYVQANLISSISTASRYVNAHILVTTNNSSYSVISEGRAAGFIAESAASNNQAFTDTLIDVTDTSNVKVKFQAVSSQTSSNSFQGSTSENKTTFLFIRLGDT